MKLVNVAIITDECITHNMTVTLNAEKGIITDITPYKPDLDVLIDNENSLDCSNFWLFPGLIDIHVHLRDLGQSENEDYNTGSLSAINGGFTTVFDMPNKKPPTNSLERLININKLTKNIKSVDIFNYVLIEDELLSESFDWIYGKIYFGGSTATSGVEYSILDKIATLSGKFFSIHAEDGEIIRQNMLEYDSTNVLDHNKIRSPKSELKAVKVILQFLQKNNNKNNHYHFAHVTLPETVEIIPNNIQNISFEVAPHHLFLCEDDVNELQELIKVNPPLRSKKDMIALRRLWVEGKIPLLASDHAPHTLENKKSLKPSGIPSLDTNLRLLLDFCITNDINPSIITKTFSSNPAKIMNMQDKGIITIGSKADLVLVDPTKSEIISKEIIKSKCKWSPWEGKELKGIPIATWKNGRIVSSHPNYHKLKEIMF